MSLFTDGTISTSEDLRIYESSILEVANTEGIELEAKLQLAQREIGVQLTAMLSQQPGIAGLSQELRNVVVTEPLRQWHAVHSLSVIFRDAYNSQLNDRYLGKWHEYAEQATRAATLLMETGIGMVRQPLDQARIPFCKVVSGGALPETIYFIQVAWVNAAGSTGGASNVISLPCPSGNLLTVKALAAPEGSVGWFLYLGVSADEMLRQNASPMGPEVVWIEPASGASGTDAGTVGQQPEFYVTRQQRLRRA
jgi:hypothetical protein